MTKELASLTITYSNCSPNTTMTSLLVYLFKDIFNDFLRKYVSYPNDNVKILII